MKRTVFFYNETRILKWILLTVLFCLPVSSGAGTEGREQRTAAVLFEQANILSTRGKFQQAIEQYSDIIRRYGVSASLLYNLANTYTAAGQVGPAVLNYERALHLAPGDADIRGSLAQVRKDAGLYQEERTLHRRLIELLGADQWLMIAGCAFLCSGMSALSAALVAEKKKRGPHRAMTGFLLIVLLTLPPAFFRYQDRKIGVVLTEDAHLLISPFADAAPAGDIRAGRLVRPETEHGDYVYVKTDNGKSGWLDRKSFAPVTEFSEAAGTR